MRKVALIYNPKSGSKRRDVMQRIEAASTVLRFASVETLPIATLGPGTAGQQTREAIESGCDTVIACGGDGTVHEVLQGMVSTEAALGIIPLGTANVLACDLGLPTNPGHAASALLSAEPRRITAGHLEFCVPGKGMQSRYFTVAAGVGADAHLAYALSAEFKRTHGMGAYYAKAAHLWATLPFPEFEVEFRDVNGRTRVETVTEVLAVRITDFGGLMRRVAPRAALHRDDVELVLVKTSSRLSYLRFLMGNMVGLQLPVPGIELVGAREVVCRNLAGQALGESRRIYVEADGEPLGRIPVRISVVPNAFTLLFPR